MKIKNFERFVNESVNEAAMKIPKKQLTKIKNNLEDENYLPAMDDETRKTLLTMIKNFELI